MKENRKSIFVMIALMLVVLGTYLIANTYAKYTTEIEGTSEASIAGWAWEINDVALTKTTNTYELNLFETINDSDAINSETDVKSGLIAPGTSGKFDIKIKNNSEVNATYNYTLSVENPLGAKIQWSDNNTTWSDNISSLNISDETLEIGSAAITKTIYWKWVFEEDATQNEKDTEVGFNAANSTEADKVIKVNATLTFTQKD